MASVFPAIGVPSENNCVVNQVMLVARWRSENPFLNIDWDEPKWDVAETYKSRTLGSKSNGSSHNLLFTQHTHRARVDGAPLIGIFGDVVKALVCSRHSQRGQTVSSHMIFVRATRYVFDVLDACSHDISAVTPALLDQAASALFARESEGAAYKVVGHLEEFADVLDANRLCRIRLDWRYKEKRRPASLSLDRIEDAPPAAEADDRLPSDGVIRAVGWLYQNIHRSESQGNWSNPDRIVVLIVTILVCTGLRISEVLTLSKQPLFTERDGTRCIRYLRLKGRKDAVAVEWRIKPLLSATVDLVNDAVQELYDLTQGPRAVAQSFFETGRLFANSSLESILTGSDVIRLVKLESTNVGQFLRARMIPYEVVSKKIRVEREVLLVGLSRDQWTRPMVPGPERSALELHEALCVVYVNQMHRGTRSTLTYAAQPIADEQIRDFLSGRVGAKSIFERYNIVNSEGSVLNARSKSFRHFLNNLLDEGGAPDLVQTKWFGRKNPADTRAYQHLTTAQRAKRVVDDVLAGNMNGKIVEVAKVLPVDVAQVFLAARIQGVHDVGPGMCVHDFQMVPCPRHLQCAAECDEFLWRSGDAERKDDLLRQAATVYLNIRTALERDADGAIVHADWMRHLKTKYTQLMKQMTMLGLTELDIVLYIKQMNRDIDR